jgi:hypothetical protein
MATAYSFVRIIVRERKWQAWYVHKFNSLPGTSPAVFPFGEDLKVPFENLKSGYISKVVVTLGIILRLM